MGRCRHRLLDNDDLFAPVPSGLCHSNDWPAAGGGFDSPLRRLRDEATFRARYQPLWHDELRDEQRPVRPCAGVKR